VISEAEIRRVAAHKKVDPMIIDLDYSLGWFLHGLITVSKWNQSCIFKGGTCLRKCYFPDYRFSEDLDFTMIQLITLDGLGKWITQTAEWITDQQGPNFLIQPTRLEIVNDEYGNETYQARIYYRGPLEWGGPPRAVKLDVTRAEIVALPAVEKPIQLSILILTGTYLRAIKFHVTAWKKSLPKSCARLPVNAALQFQETSTTFIRL